MSGKPRTEDQSQMCRNLFKDASVSEGDREFFSSSNLQKGHEAATSYENKSEINSSAFGPSHKDSFERTSRHVDQQHEEAGVAEPLAQEGREPTREMDETRATPATGRVGPSLGGDEHDQEDRHGAPGVGAQDQQGQQQESHPGDDVRDRTRASLDGHRDGGTDGATCASPSLSACYPGCQGCGGVREILGPRVPGHQPLPAGVPRGKTDAESTECDFRLKRLAKWLHENPPLTKDKTVEDLLAENITSASQAGRSSKGSSSSTVHTARERPDLTGLATTGRSGSEPPGRCGGDERGTTPSQGKPQAELREHVGGLPED